MALWFRGKTNTNIEIGIASDKNTFDTGNENWTYREFKSQNGWKNKYRKHVYFPMINGKKVNKSWAVVSGNLTVITNNYIE